MCQNPHPHPHTAPKPPKYIMLRQQLTKQFNPTQWHQISSHPNATHFRLQNKIYQYLINNQQLFSKYFLLFFTNNVRLYHWALLSTDKHYEINRYVNRRLLMRDYEQYRREMKFRQMRLVRERERVREGEVEREVARQAEREREREREKCRERNREREREMQREKQRQGAYGNQNSNYCQQQDDLQKQNQQQITKLKLKQKKSQREKQKQIKQLKFKQKFKQQQSKPIQQFRKYQYKIDDLSHQIFNFVANKSLTASLLIWQKPWSRNNPHSNSYCHNKNNNKHCRLNSSDQPDYQNNTFCNLNSNSTANTNTNPNNQRSITQKSTNSNPRNPQPSPFRSPSTPNPLPNRKKSPPSTNPVPSTTSVPDKQNLLKQVNTKFFQNHDFHELYLQTFHACDGPRYIFYNYEKHMKGQSQKDKYNTFIRGWSNKRNYKVMDVRMTEVSEEETGTDGLRELRSCEVGRGRSSYQYEAVGSAVGRGVGKKGSKVVFKRTRGNKASCGKFIRK